MIYKLLQHGHNARLEKHSEGWKIVLTLDGVYFDEAAALVFHAAAAAHPPVRRAVCPRHSAGCCFEDVSPGFLAVEGI